MILEILKLKRLHSLNTSDAIRREVICSPSSLVKSLSHIVITRIIRQVTRFHWFLFPWNNEMLRLERMKRISAWFPETKLRESHI